MSGTVVLVGGDELPDAPWFDDLIEASGADQALVLPTAGAFEGPARLVEVAAERLASVGCSTHAVDILRRSDALDEESAEVIRHSRLIHLCGSSPLHLRSVLTGTPVWEALIGAVAGGATVVAVGGAAVGVCDPMIDPRGGAPTVGLGLVRDVSVMAGVEPPPEDVIARTVELAGPGHAVVSLAPGSGLVRADQGWRRVGSAGDGGAGVRAWLDHAPIEIDGLPRA